MVIFVLDVLRPTKPRPELAPPILVNDAFSSIWIIFCQGLEAIASA
jgi:hypothetical protein